MEGSPGEGIHQHRCDLLLKEPLPPRLPVAHHVEWIALFAFLQKVKNLDGSLKKKKQRRTLSKPPSIPRVDADSEPALILPLTASPGRAVWRACPRLCLAIDTLFSETLPSARLWEGQTPELLDANPRSHWTGFGGVRLRVSVTGVGGERVAFTQVHGGMVIDPASSQAAGDPSHGSNPCGLPGGGGGVVKVVSQHPSDGLGRALGLRGC